jgi:acylphosphatase
MQQRRIVWFSGAVQGVGFRYTTLSVARRFDVTGYVRNLRDGRVELVVESEPPQGELFIEAVRQEMADYIRSVEEKTEPAKGTFRDFSVKF